MSAPVRTSPSAIRWIVLATAAIVIVGAGASAFRGLFLTNRSVPVDFAAFWAAGDLSVRGENPYDPAAVLARQHDIGLTNDAAVMMWNPPWVLALVMPFALLPSGPAYGLWALVHIGLVLAATELLWRGFAPPRSPLGGRDASHYPPRERHMHLRVVAYPLALLFVPTTYLIGIGQITAVVLAGLAGFVVLSRAGRPLLAGAAVAVTAVKPHLLTVFAAWLLLDAIGSHNGRRVLAGGVLVGLVVCALLTCQNPEVWEQYYRAVTAPADADHISVANWTAPVLGSWIRASLPGQPFWVQFVPPLLAVVGFGVWYCRTGRTLNTDDRAALAPWVVAGSLLVSPYGAWAFDLVLLLPLILATAAHVARAPTTSAIVVGIGAFTAVNAALLAMMLTCASSELYVWVTPAVLVGSLVVWRLVSNPSAVSAPVRPEVEPCTASAAQLQTTTES